MNAVPPAGPAGAAEPLALVAAAVAGGDLAAIARQTAEGCERPVLIVLGGEGPTIRWPPGVDDPDQLGALAQVAATPAGDLSPPLPAGVADLVPVRLGDSVVGIIAALGDGPAELTVRRWLDAGAAAAAVATLMTDGSAATGDDARQNLLAALEATGLSTADPPAGHPRAGTPSAGAALGDLLDQAEALGHDLQAGALGLCAIAPSGTLSVPPTDPSTLIAPVGADRLLGLVPRSIAGTEERRDALLRELAAAGARVAGSRTPRDADQLGIALVEAALLAELASEAAAPARHAAAPPPADAPAPPPTDVAEEPPGDADTLALLIGVLCRDPAELERLRDSTVSALRRYDAEHDTELVATLRCFLARHGSTTETAEAMSLHRHTVGYRLVRVQEVAGLSPYTSEGRERLSLGLKADRILAAETRRQGRLRQADSQLG